MAEIDEAELASRLMDALGAGAGQLSDLAERLGPAPPKPPTRCGQNAPRHYPVIEHYQAIWAYFGDARRPEPPPLEVRARIRGFVDAVLAQDAVALGTMPPWPAQEHLYAHDAGLTRARKYFREAAKAQARELIPEAVS